MKRRILIIGCGSIGERHLRCFLKTQRTEVFACDTNATLLEKMATQYQVPVHASLETALAAGQHDAVVICTPADTHLKIAGISVRHGANVLIEKPLSIGMDNVDSLEDALARFPRFVRIAYVYHVMPALVQAREFLRAGSLGQPRHVAVTAGQHFPTFRPAYRDTYYSRHETGGGAIQDALTHLANAVEWVVGPATRLQCDAAHQVLEGVDVEDTVVVAARHGEIVASYALNQFQAPNETTLQFNCERGSVKVEVHGQRWAVYPHGAASWEHHPAPVTDRDQLFVAQANAFLDGIEGKAEGLCTLEEAVQTLRFNMAALKSSRTGRAVDLS